MDSQLKDYNHNYLFTLNVYSDCYYQWFKFIKDEFNIPLTIENEFEECFKLQRESGIYSAIFSKIVCVISKYPQRVNRDGENRLHNTTGQAVEWGFSTEETKMDYYYIHGRNIPADKYELAINKKIKRDDFIGEANEEIRGAYYEILGEEYILNLIGAEEIDKGVFNHANGDIEPVILLKTKQKIINDQPLSWVKFICPSTQAPFLIACDPIHTSAVDAAISLSIFNREEYSFNYRT